MDTRLLEALLADVLLDGRGSSATERGPRAGREPGGTPASDPATRGGSGTSPVDGGGLSDEWKGLGAELLDVALALAARRAARFEIACGGAGVAWCRSLGLADLRTVLVDGLAEAGDDGAEGELPSVA